MGMSDLISESYGVHFTSSLLKELKKDVLLKHFEKEVTWCSCHNEKEISLSWQSRFKLLYLGPIKDKLIDKEIITKGTGAGINFQIC